MIKEKLTEEGWKISEHTVFDDLHSETADEFLEELKRQQLADITRAQTDYKTRLQYRGQMIEILTPKQTINKNEQVGEIKLSWLNNADSSASSEVHPAP
jgi:signal recognition particle GTPase